MASSFTHHDGHNLRTGLNEAMAIPRAATAPDSDPWSAFWSTAELHGSVASFPASARDAIEARWKTFFRSVDSDARVLDIGCGKGAVLSYAQEAGHPDDLLVGVDRVAASVISGAGFDLQGGIDAANLPFADQAFQCVVSQFGIEYACLPGAIREAARVCSVSMLLLVHAKDGVVYRQALEQEGQIEWIARELELFGRARTHFSIASAQSAADMEALLRALVDQAEAAENVSLLEGVYRSLLDLQDCADPLSGLAALERELIAHQRRMRAMIAAAPDAASMDALPETLRQLGFIASIENTDDGADRIGRWIAAYRLMANNGEGAKK